MLSLPIQADDFFLNAAFPAVLSHRIQFLQTLDGFLHRGHVGEQTAEPALVHIKLRTADGFLGNRFLSLALSADKQDDFSGRGGHVLHINRMASLKSLQRSSADR